jgi:L-amino acid N-acyltransferase YncA
MPTRSDSQAGDTQVRLRPAVEADLPAINRIYNEEIRTGVATFDLEEWTAARRAAWFAEHDPDETPILVAELDGRLVGFGYLSLFGGKPGYYYTRENTVFVDPAYQRRGIGQLLLDAIVEEARRVGAHTLIARIEASNEGSIEIHRRAGYELTGREREVGRKFDRWLDVVVMTRLVEDSGSASAR